MILMLVVFYVPWTARSFRDGTAILTVPCELRKAWFLHRSQPESNPRPSSDSPLHFHCTTPIIHVSELEFYVTGHGILKTCDYGLNFVSNN